MEEVECGSQTSRLGLSSGRRVGDLGTRLRTYCEPWSWIRSTHPTQLAQFQSMKQSLEAEEKAEKLAELQAKWERWECAASLQATFQAQMRAKKKSTEEQRKGEQVGACCSWTCHRVPLHFLVCSTCWCFVQERRLHDLEEEGEIERAATEEYLQQLETQAHNNRESIIHREAMVGDSFRLHSC